LKHRSLFVQPHAQSAFQLVQNPAKEHFPFYSLSSFLFPSSLALCCALLKPKAFDALKADCTQCGKLWAAALRGSRHDAAFQRQLFCFFLSAAECACRHDNRGQWQFNIQLCALT